MMNDNNTLHDGLADIRGGMQALKDNLPDGGLISEDEIRRSMRRKSAWLNRVVTGEFILLPFLIGGGAMLVHTIGINPWLVITFAIIAIIDALLDMRTFAISKKWILDDTLLDLSRKLVRQKLERQRQTVVSTLLMIPWGIWSIYEFLLHSPIPTAEGGFYVTWAIFSGFSIGISLVIIVLIYSRAQRTNTELLRQLNSYDD